MKLLPLFALYALTFSALYPALVMTVITLRHDLNRTPRNGS